MADAVCLYVLFWGIFNIFSLHRVEWGKVGRFFAFLFNSAQIFNEIKNFMIDNGQCVSSLLPQGKKSPKKFFHGGATPHFFLMVR